MANTEFIQEGKRKREKKEEKEEKNKRKKTNMKIFREKNKRQFM
jgi:hypothetical protein